MNLNQLRYFMEAAKYLNFSRAAEALFISQPAFSRQISKFEESIGVSLFERGNRGLTLTPAGEILAREADGIFRREQELLRKLRGASARKPALIKLVYANDVLLQRLNDFVLDYNKMNPEQRFSVNRYSWVNLRQALSRASLDIALSLRGDLDDIPGVRCRVLHKTANMIVMSPNHPFADRESVSMLDLKDETIMMPEASLSFAYRELIDVCQQYGFTPKFNKDHPILKNRLLEVALGNGVSPMVQELIPEIRRMGLVGVPCPDMPPLEFVVAWNETVETGTLLSVIDAIAEYRWF